MAKNNAVQKISIDKTKYLTDLKNANQETKKNFKSMNDDIIANYKVLEFHESKIRQWGRAAADEFAKARKSFNENVIMGMKAQALTAVTATMATATKGAIDMGFKFSESFATLGSIANASKDQMKSWRKEIMSIATETGANMDELSDSFAGLFTSVKDPKELMKIMEVLGSNSKLTGGKSIDVAGKALQTLKDQGKEINSANIEDYLASADLLRRKGVGVQGGQAGAANMLSSVSGQDIKNSGFSMRDLAATFAAMTHVKGVNGDSSKDLMKEVLQLSSNQIMQGSVAASIFGKGTGRESIMKNGKLDLGALTSDTARSKVLGMGGANEQENREIFKKVTGMSDLFYNLIMNGKEYQSSLQEVTADTVSFASVTKMAGDNLEKGWRSMLNGMIEGFTDIFGGFEESAKKLFSGDIIGAAKSAFNGIPEMMSGMMNNKKLVAGWAGATWLQGAGINSVLKSIAGGGGTGSAAAGAGSKVLSALNPAAKVIGAGLAGYTAGTMLNDNVIDPYTTEKNKYGQKSNLTERLIGAASVATGSTSASEFDEMYGGGSPVLDKMIKTLDSLQKSIDNLKDSGFNIEIDSKDPMFSGKPKSTDNPKDARF